MRKLVVTTMVLGLAASASAIGVGMYFDYNPVAKITAPEFGRELFGVSFIGFDVGVVFQTHKYVHVIGGVGYQRFSGEETYGFYEYDYSQGIIPVIFGVEFPLVVGNFVICPGGGSGYTNFTGDLDVDPAVDAWLRCKFHYMLNPNLGMGFGVTYSNVFTDPDPVSWLRAHAGVKYWFM
jgi:hypothetical protein